MPHPAPSRPAAVTCLHEPSWRLASDRVEAYLTRAGGHLAPVTFTTAAGPVQPFALPPWHRDELPRGTPRVLRMLRGDFFCAPFGNNTTAWRGEQHPPHGETAADDWKLIGVSAGPDGPQLVAELRPRIRPGVVRKRIALRSGETNVYCRHELAGFTGPMNLGHHAMLQFPDAPGAGRLALSRWVRGQVCPVPFEHLNPQGRSALRIGARFTSLDRVPQADGGTARLAAFPARRGCDDLVMVSSARPRGAAPTLAWTTVTFLRAGYVWLALKDPRVLASTILWHSNGGRRYPPWSGRHRPILGLEEVTSYFHFGLAESAAPNPVSRAGIPTALMLRPHRPTVVNYVMGVAAIPRGFDVVRAVDFRRDHLVLHAASGRRVEHAVDLGFFHPTA